MISRIFFCYPPLQKTCPSKPTAQSQAMSLVEGWSRQATHRWGHMWHETNKKPLRWGCEGWRPIVVVMPKSNGKHASPLSFAVTPTVARDARPSHPLPWRKKSRSAKKKSASPKKNAPTANSGPSCGRHIHPTAPHCQTAN